jgi:proteasome lid subunit RPN8/RPN11
MSNELGPMEIPHDIMLKAFEESRKAFPAECCGWMAGPDEGSVSSIRPCANHQEKGGHPIASERGSETAYVIEGDDLFELNRSFDGDTPARIIYHSHPNGLAYLSPTDREVAASPWGDGPAFPVQQLVVGIDENRVVEAALFTWSDDAGEFVEVARFEGAEY